MTDLSKIPLPEGWKVLVDFIWHPSADLVVTKKGAIRLPFEEDVCGCGSGTLLGTEDDQSSFLRAFTEAVEIARLVRQANKEDA